MEADELLFQLKEIPVPMVYATYRIIRDCNEEFCRLFGYRGSELIGRSFARLYPKHADFVRTGKMWQENMRGGQVYYDERIMISSDGRRFWCQVHGRTRHATDPFAKAIYCFQPIARKVAEIRFRLTDRQFQIVALVAQGKTNASIGRELRLSVRTIESHRARIMKTWGFKNTAELIAAFSNQNSE
ncbi:helix-turn-helix transcriptional regulator [Rhizobium mesoamericanum]|uniref:Transcriptional regulator, LuxR family n=1 Tax=Rhizobium mesoamericanum STM3625 TaxID=1211777 RepID=K0PQF6_9HYPH|nr:PAS domain S-box protein [Rhizobium mesoamericanum]CCM78871.1 Transcriptional regulator, LuxR family [Rhizobium mesoamericanum STM3625]